MLTVFVIGFACVIAAVVALVVISIRQDSWVKTEHGKGPWTKNVPRKEGDDDKVDWLDIAGW
jgi:hypothetical protein